MLFVMCCVVSLCVLLIVRWLALFAVCCCLFRVADVCYLLLTFVACWCLWLLVDCCGLLYVACLLLLRVVCCVLFVDGLFCIFCFVLFSGV